MRTVASAILAAQGYCVLTAANGEAALALSATHEGEIQLLLTDVVMPGIAGPALAERLSKKRPELRVLYTSGYTKSTARLTRSQSRFAAKAVHHRVTPPQSE